MIVLPVLALVGSAAQIAQALRIPDVVAFKQEEPTSVEHLSITPVPSSTGPSKVVPMHKPQVSMPYAPRPVLPGDNDAPSVKLSSYTSHSSHSGSSGSVSVSYSSGGGKKEEEEEEGWACDIGAWVRAPDPQPNFKTAGDARLVANGTDCKDIKSWTLGLQYKEREIVRLHAKDAVFPVKPEWTSDLDSGVGGDIFDLQSPWGPGRRSSPYDDMMTEYNSIISNPDLWEVHGAEHVLFDAQLLLESASEDEQLPLNVVRPFELHVPNTNFPPKTSSSFSYEMLSDEMISHESQFQYYFQFVLHNGSTLYYPAGVVGFLPFSSAEVEDDKKSSTEKVIVNLETRSPGFSYYHMRSRQAEPRCDEGNTTSFRLEIDVPISRSFALDSLSYLDATLYKLDNSSDQIQSLNLTTLVSHTNNLTWAKQFPRAVEANLTNQEGGWVDGTKSRFDSPHRLLRVPSAEQLEFEASMSEGGMSWWPYRDGGLYRHGWTGRPEQAPPVALDPKAEVQRIKIPVKVFHDDVLDFRSTFIDIISRLDLRITTRFACAQDLESVVDLKAKEDAEWSAWRIDLSSQQPDSTRGPTHAYNGNFTIRTHGPKSNSTTPLAHFLDEGARAPVLTLPNESPVFPLVGAVRDESGDDLKQERYRSDRYGGGRNWWRWVPSGEHEHAAMIWLRKEKMDAAAQAKVDAEQSVESAQHVLVADQV